MPPRPPTHRSVSAPMRGQRVGPEHPHGLPLARPSLWENICFARSRTAGEGPRHLRAALTLDRASSKFFASAKWVGGVASRRAPKSRPSAPLHDAKRQHYRHP